ncbi:MAG: hypothetical protein EHM16_10065 [Betaproteobacteria bacterium]|nr:MAG: hypothetical protein EHM16_10065 [Betaproteobacteria bacterium]
MANKLLLCISVNGATAARWKRGRLHDCEVFTNDDAGIAAFREFAAGSRGAPAFIIVDAVEEDYRFETLPHATGSDRAQMVERKLRQYYRGSPYSAASLIGRDSSKRRDDRFLFSALTNPEVVTPWLNALVEAELPIGGVYLLPMVIPRLVSVLENKSDNLLLVAAHPAGLRLTFFREGAFRLSRLSRVDAAAGAHGRALIDEISNTRLYLHALRAATLDEPVTVVLLDHADRLEAITRAIGEDNPGLSCTRLGRNDIAARLKLDPALIGISPATIYLHLLGAKSPGSNLASPATTATYRRYQARRQLFAASAIAASIGVVVSGFNLSQQLAVRSSTEETARRTAQVNAEYQAATRQFPAAPTTADNLKKATELAQQLRTSATTPERFFGIVGRALAPSPEITLVELGWQHRAAEFEPGAAATGTAPAGRAAESVVAGPRKQSGLVAGQVRDFKGDFRRAIAAINALAERLRNDPAVDSVRIVQLPLNVSSTLSLSGNTSDNPAQAGNADFKLVLVLKQPS